MGGLFGGSEPSISYAQSPQQAQGMQMTLPLLQKAFGQATGTPYISGYETVNVPGSYSPMPSGSWRDYGLDYGSMDYSQPYQQQTAPYYYQKPIYTTPQESTTLNLWDIPSYNIPSPYNLPQAPQPTAGWFKSISPNVMQGLWEPYDFAASQLGERMGASGSIGSARGGYSGTAADAFGRFYSDAGKDIGMNAWNMMLPGMQNQWQAELTRNMGMWGEQLGLNKYMAQQQLQQNQYPWNLAPTLWGASMPSTVVNQGQQGLFESVLPIAEIMGMGALMGPAGAAAGTAAAGNQGFFGPMMK